MIYGFIGLGNMATAILQGMCRSGGFEGDTLCGYDRQPERMRQLGEQLGLEACSDEMEVYEKSDLVLLCVKPQVMASVLPEAAKAGKPLVTIAAGKDIPWYEAIVGDMPIVRAMPNINGKVGAAATAICANERGQAWLDKAQAVFSTIGRVFRLPESQFPVFGAISGASVAFVYLYIDALSRAGVKNGLSRQLAQEIAAAVVLGSGKLVQESGEHPMALVDQVCSPAGTTIEGIMTLQRLGFESAVQQAVQAVVDKDEKLKNG